MSDRTPKTPRGPSPEERAEKLRTADTAPTTQASGVSVCLGLYDNGYAYFSWNAQTVGDDDFVGYYADPATPAGKPTTYENVDGNSSGSYQTGEGMYASAVARYVVWDHSSKSWVAVASTAGFPGQICS